MVRKPLNKMEGAVPMSKPAVPVPQAKEPYVIRLKPRDVARIRVIADRRKLGHSTVAREFLLTGLKMAELEDALKDDIRITA